MVATVQMNRQQPPAEETPVQGDDTGAASVPFIRASDENVSPAGIDKALQITAGAQQFGVFNVKSYGHAAYLTLLVTTTGGVGGGANVVGHEDSPFNAITNIALTEPNGAYIVQFPSGHHMMLANKYGGYTHPPYGDPRSSVIFSDVAEGAGATGHFTFLVRVPVALSDRDAVGALPNQDSSGEFKFHASLAASATIYTTAPATTLPTVRMRGWLHAWDQPEVQSAGMVNATAPPGSGTTSFWQVQSGVTVNAGNNDIEIKRKGNYWRVVIFVLRRAGTSRANGESDWPDETRFLRDAFPARYYQDEVWKHMMYERTGYRGTADAALGPENGVRVHDYMHEFDGMLGREMRDLWQPTRGSTRAEISGSFDNAGTLDIMVNDVAIAEDVFL